MSFVKSQKGGNILYYDGYIYRKNKVHSTSVSWRCTKKECKGRVIVNDDRKTQRPNTIMLRILLKKSYIFI